MVKKLHRITSPTKKRTKKCPAGCGIYLLLLPLLLRPLNSRAGPANLLEGGGPRDGAGVTDEHTIFHAGPRIAHLCCHVHREVLLVLAPEGVPDLSAELCGWPAVVQVEDTVAHLGLREGGREGWEGREGEGRGGEGRGGEGRGRGGEGRGGEGRE